MMHYNHNVVINDNDVRVRMINSTFFATRVSHDSDTDYIQLYRLYLKLHTLYANFKHFVSHL